MKASVVAVAFAESEVQDKVSMPLDCDEAISVAEVRIVAGLHGLLLLAEER
jgi:hypothetical protein